MGWKQCADRIRAAVGDSELSDEQVAAIYDAVEARAATKRQASTLLSADEAFRLAAAERGNEERLAAMLEKRSRMINVLRKQGRFDFLTTAEGGTAKAYSAMMVGREGPGFGMAKSVDAEIHGIAADLMGPMAKELRNAGLLSIIKRKTEDFERNVARELWRLDFPTAPGSGDRLAAQAAAIFGKYQETLRLMKNEEGAYIRKLPGWIVRQSHDSWKIAHAATEGLAKRTVGKPDYEASFTAWRDFIAPLLDERTFEDTPTAAGREKFLRNVYNNIVSGDHSVAGAGSDWLGGFSGPGNLAKRLSQERELHFKSSDAWFEYNKRFGSGNLLEAIVGGLRGGARDVGLMRRFGTNPEAAFKADQQQLIRAARDRGDHAEVERLKSWRIEAEFNALTGKSAIPGDPTLAARSNIARALLSMAKLGGVVLSSLPDIAVRAAALRHHGIGFLEGFLNGLESVFRGRSSGFVRELNDHLGIGIDGVLGSMHANFNAADLFAGKTSRAMETFFKFNLLNWWTDSMKTGMGQILSHNLGRNAGVAYDLLNEDLRRSLGRYGIDAGMWDHIRTKGLTDDAGKAFITADGLDKEARIALRTYFVDTVNEGMTIGGARERAIVTGGTQAGTPWGEAARFIMQFKSFPITFYQRSLRRELLRKGSVDKAGLAWLIAGTTAMGYLSMTAKELAKGRNPRDALASPGALARTMGAAMTQGGGLGIYGDFLLGDYNRFGGGGLETLAGPAVGTASEVLRIYGGLRDGTEKTADVFRFGVNNAPFVNMFYTRIALDWLVLWHMNELMSPGWADRFEKNTAKNNAQTFWLSPTETVKHWPPSPASIHAPRMVSPITTNTAGVTIEGGP